MLDFSLSPTDFADKMLQWYDNNRRILPWREDATPYHVWLSEIMLQQTQVKTMLPFYERFIATLPTIEALAQTDKTKLYKLWEGLGYYSRADHLHTAAQQVMQSHDGLLPDTYDALLALPGIGPYTAGAIASIAFGQRICAVDGNVLRILSRLTGYDQPINVSTSAKPLHLLAQSLVPAHRPGDFNQSLMDLGALICRSNGAPHCTQCPVSAGCKAYLQQQTGMIPVKKQKKSRTIEQHSIVILVSNQKVWIHRRPQGQLLADLWEFKNFPDFLSEKDLLALLKEQQLPIQTIYALGATKHIFTHKEWHMQGWLVSLEQPVIIDSGQWVDISELQTTYPMASALSFYRSLLFEHFL